MKRERELGKMGEGRGKGDGKGGRREGRRERGGLQKLYAHMYVVCVRLRTQL